MREFYSLFSSLSTPQSRESSAFSPSHWQSGSNALACKRRSACPTRKECARGPGDAAPGRFGSQQGSAGTCQRIHRRLPGSAATDDSGSSPPQPVVNQEVNIPDDPPPLCACQDPERLALTRMPITFSLPLFPSCRIPLELGHPAGSIEGSQFCYSSLCAGQGLPSSTFRKSLNRNLGPPTSG